MYPERFTIRRLRDELGLTLNQTEDNYGHIRPMQPTPLLPELLKRTLPLVVGKSSEKTRSELIIAPVLVELREQVQRKVTLFSGVKLDVDRKADLYGYCDFLISRDPIVISVEAPVIAVAEAKKEDINAGIPQCIAEMVGAQRFNKSRGQDIPTIYGVATSGTDWRFLQLDGDTVTIDLREYPITELPQILGILVHMAS